VQIILKQNLEERLSSTHFFCRKDSAMKREPSSAMQKETGSWMRGSWAKIAHEIGATGAMEGAGGALVR